MTSYKPRRAVRVLGLVPRPLSCLLLTGARSIWLQALCNQALQAQPEILPGNETGGWQMLRASGRSQYARSRTKVDPQRDHRTLTGRAFLTVQYAAGAFPPPSPPHLNPQPPTPQHPPALSHSVHLTSLAAAYALKSL